MKHNEYCLWDFLVGKGKKAVREFARYVHGDFLGHLWDDNVVFSQGRGPCDLCKRTCLVDPDTGVDLVVGGIPCQPFSKLRVRNGDTAKSASTEAHPK